MSVSRILAVLAMLAVILGFWFFATSAASQAAGVSQPEQPPASREPVELLKSDATGIAFAVELSGLVLDQDLVHGVVYDTVSVPGFGMSTKIGSPQVPTRRVLLGIPLGAEYHLRISTDQSETVPDRYSLLPAPTPVLEPAFESDPQLDLQVSASGAAGWDYIEDEGAYSTDALYPDVVAKVVSSGFIRDQRFIAVQVNPVQYNPVTGELVLHKQIAIEIDFTYPHGLELGTGRSDASFEPVLRAGLLNYESAAHWRGKSTSPVPTVNLAAEIRDADSPALKIMVDEDGIYKVTAAELEALDIPVSTLPTSTYKLSYRDREVPIRVLESETEPGRLESLWFYGERARSKYTDTNVYRLTYESSSQLGLRMPTRAAPPDPVLAVSPFYSTTVRLEEDHKYRSQLPWTEASDHWFWDYTFYPDSRPTLTFSVAFNGLATLEPYEARFSASIVGYTDGDHCVQFSLDPSPLGSYVWTDYSYKDEQLVHIPFDASILNEGMNELRVEGCLSDATMDYIYYDWFELNIRRNYEADNDTLAFEVAEDGWQYQLDGFTTDAIEIFDISGTYTVSQLVGFDVTPAGPPYSASFYDETAEQDTRYLALTRDQMKSPVSIVKDTSSNLRNWSTPPDYIIIAPQEFVADVQPLADHRAAQGLAVQIADLESIFDEFNYGTYSPEAIRAFLEYEYDHWYPDPPSFVLLVGDGTYDYKGNLPDGNPNLLPPYLAWVDYSRGETAADNRYVSVNGDDPFPDMYIGRFPAESSAHVQAMVQKTIAYETNPAPREWIEHVLFVADDRPIYNDDYYYNLSDELINDYLPEPYDPIRVYYMDTCLSGDSCTQTILDTLNSTGALFVNYIGHGGVRNWAATVPGDPKSTVWHIDDLASLESTTHWPVMLPMTCDEGSFHEATIDALAEETVRFAADRGAVASWSPTGEGYASGHQILNTSFLSATLKEGVRQLGVAADVGKARLFATDYYTDLLETYHIFGDPALRLNPIVDVAVGQAIDAPEMLNPGDLVTITLTFANAGPGIESGVVLADRLPPMLVEPSLIYSGPATVTLQAGTMLAWEIDGIPPGASGEIVIEATIDPEWPESDVSFFNTAQITPLSYDQNLDNNFTRVGVNLKSVYLPLIMKRS